MSVIVHILSKRKKTPMKRHSIPRDVFRRILRAAKSNDVNPKSLLEQHNKPSSFRSSSFGRNSTTSTLQTALSVGLFNLAIGNTNVSSSSQVALSYIGALGTTDDDGT